MADLDLLLHPVLFIQMRIKKKIAPPPTHTHIQTHAQIRSIYTFKVQLQLYSPRENDVTLTFCINISPICNITLLHAEGTVFQLQLKCQTFMLVNLPSFLTSTPSVCHLYACSRMNALSNKALHSVYVTMNKPK